MARTSAAGTPAKRTSAPTRQAAGSAAKSKAVKPRGAAAKQPATAGKPAATKKAVTRKAPTAKAVTKKAPTSRRATAVAAVDRTADLSQDVLTSIESAQRAALDAIRAFVDTVDEVLPAVGQRPSRREQVIDAALEMADRLVATQYDFLRNTVRSADRSLKAALPEGK